MTLEITLRRQVDTVLVRFAGEVSQRRSRNDLLVGVMTVIEHAGEVAIEEVTDHLFGGRRGFAQGLLLDAERHGLVRSFEDRRYTVTDGGLDALRAGMVFEPRFETWDLVLTDDDAVGVIPISLEVADAPRLFDATRGTGAPGARIPTPDAMPLAVADPISPLSQPGEDYILPDLEGVDLHCFTEPATYWLEYDVFAQTSALRAGGASYRVPVEIPVEAGRVLEAVFPNGRWNKERSILEVTPSEFSDQDLVNGAIRGTWHQVDLEPLGIFSVSANDIPIAPAQPSDYLEWVVRRLAVTPPEPASEPNWAARLGSEATAVGARRVAVPREDVLAHLERTERRGTPAWWKIRSALDWEI